MPRRLSLPRRESRRGASTDCTCTQVALWRGVLGARPGWSAASPPRDRERDPRGVCTFALARASVSPHPQVARRTPVGAPPHRNRRRPPHDRDHCTSPRRTGELAVRGGCGKKSYIRRFAGRPRGGTATRASRARRRRPRAPAGRAGGHASRRGPDRATRVRRTRARRRGDCVLAAAPWPRAGRLDRHTPARMVPITRSGSGARAAPTRAGRVMARRKPYGTAYGIGLERRADVPPGQPDGSS